MTLILIIIRQSQADRHTGTQHLPEIKITIHNKIRNIAAPSVTWDKERRQTYFDGWSRFGCYAVSSGKQSSTFRRSTVPPCWRSKTAVNVYSSAPRNITESLNRDQHCCESPKLIDFTLEATSKTEKKCLWTIRSFLSWLSLSQSQQIKPRLKWHSMWDGKAKEWF